MFELLTNDFILPLFLALLFQLLFIWALFSCFAFHKIQTIEKSPELPSVSVVITAKNEDENLRQNLPGILEQDYPDFEVIVVDDQSEDRTLDILQEYEKTHANLRIVSMASHIRDHTGKKLALTLAFRKSRKDILLLTDADCHVASDQWIRKMTANYAEGVNFVLGYSPYQQAKGLLNLFIQFDTFYTALQYFSFTLAKMPYMGVGRNMSYRKQIFYNKGFAAHLDVPYGDDDLFVNDHAHENDVAIEYDPSSFMYSKPHSSVIRWFEQKRRHLKGGKEYQKRHKYWLGALWLSNFLFYTTFIISLVFHPLSLWIWGLFAVMFLSKVLVYGYALKKLNNLRLIWLAPFLDVFYHLIYTPLMSLVVIFSKKENGW